MSNSEEKNRYWRTFHVLDNGNLKTGDVFYNITNATLPPPDTAPTTSAHDDSNIPHSSDTSDDKCTADTCQPPSTPTSTTSSATTTHTASAINIAPGNPDGLKVDIFGNVFATGKKILFTYIIYEEYTKH